MWPFKKIEPLVHLSTISMESMGNYLQLTNNVQLNSAASSVFPSANRAIFVPFSVFKTFVPTTMFVLNGATASGNIDVGVYTLDGTKLWSAGSTAQSGTSVIQSFAVSGLELTAGQYYFAVAMSNTTGTLYRWVSGNVSYDKMFGLAQMASAFALPATATLATVTTDWIPFIGLTTRSVV